jgi:hypothetical protein
MLHSQTVFAVASRPEKYIDHAHEVSLCPQADCRRSSSFSKNSPDAPDQIADQGGLHVKGSKMVMFCQQLVESGPMSLFLDSRVQK